MRRLSVETNYSPFKYGYYFHLLYIIMPIAYFLAHSILEQSYKEIEFPMNMVQIEFEKSIPYLSFMSVLFFVMIAVAATLFVFLAIKDVCAFKRYMIFLFIGLFICVLAAAGFPNYNTLLPNIQDDNSFFGSLMKIIVGYDSNINNFPSTTTIVAASIVYAAFDSKKLNYKWIKIVSIVLAVLFIASSIFIKRNSLYDILGAGIICGIMLIPINLIKRRDMLKIGEERIKRDEENGWTPTKFY